MADIQVNGVRLAYEVAGEGEMLVLVHGSWGDRHNWDAVFEPLARSFRVLRYDRRGHSESERPASQGSFEEDANDLADLIEALGTPPVHVVGNSGGAAIVLKLASKRAELFRSLAVHEPPSFRIVRDVAALAPIMDSAAKRVENVVELLNGGRIEEGARTFAEQIAFGPGMWPKLPEALRKTFVFNAPTFLDEARDPNGLDLDLPALATFAGRALVTDGDASPPFFRAIVDRIAAAMPHSTRFTFAGAGHVPHATHPAEYVRRVSNHLRGASQ